MAKNTGIPYEKLAQRIFDTILNEYEDETTEIEHNVTLEGITTNHQIDVYWEFEYGGIIYKNIVQAKDLGTPV